MISMNRGFKLLTATALALAVSACSFLQQQPEGTYEQDKTYKLTVLHTNDHHGRFWRDHKGRWGMSARMTLVNEIRQEVKDEGGNVLLLSGGDVNSGVPESDLQDAIPDFKGMNLLGYDAMAVGNHEFDKPRDVLMMQQDIADFPFLSANIIDEKTGSPLFKPYTTFEFDGLRVAVMGLTTIDTPKATDPANTAGLDFISPVKATSQLMPELKKASDIVIVSSHLGYYEDANHGVNSPGDVTLARNVDGIDMIFGGHSHQTLERPDKQNGTYIFQANELGKFIGRADFEFRNGVLKLVSYKLIPVNHKEITIKEDPAMLALLAPYHEKGAKLVEARVGSVDERLMGERSEVRFQPTDLGTMITQAFIEKTGADFATMNGGGIRASIPAGEITYKNILTVLPFGNTLTTVEMNGQEVMDYLNVVALKPANSGAFAHFSGIEMVIESGAVHDVRIGGEAIDLNKTYKMALLSFSAGGGDNYPNVKKMPGFVDTGFADAEVLREFTEKHSPLKVSDFTPAGIVRK
ncbi:bifunctional UDP-sugar hydrolase/5'-nucleotidase UshA [Sansalvadorimonas verongulae]|uniref:bifunctional UDP-sugar hydrolase/5'-nucleotidase UshA n=1 Tax=Sansalvadorimonas verongulae TaxID=2172824 RepID=UPI0012BBFFBC|nr:bifunctional UDP-sugar hydrolase/5'-nucleotidase UshA [Sansalvadorimonas verongulae]MTI14199.1 bifunctional UDP-sugar hydrolase/5'-nucleotidase [Sansalvadorimonas verongulae]